MNSDDWPSCLFGLLFVIVCAAIVFYAIYLAETWQCTQLGNAFPEREFRVDRLTCQVLINDQWISTGLVSFPAVPIE